MDHNGTVGAAGAGVPGVVSVHQVSLNGSECENVSGWRVFWRLVRLWARACKVHCSYTGPPQFFFLFPSAAEGRFGIESNFRGWLYGSRRVRHWPSFWDIGIIKVLELKQFVAKGGKSCSILGCPVTAVIFSLIDGVALFFESEWSP